MNRYFIARMLGCILVLSGLFVYQGKAQEWQKAKEENQKQVAEVENYNRQIEKEQRAKKEEALYKDGSYEETAKGFGGDIVVSVTIQSDTITAVEVVSAKKEDSAYLSMAMEMPKRIIDAQSYEVDTVTGATYSSTGIKNAVKAALEKAK